MPEWLLKEVIVVAKLVRLLSPLYWAQPLHTQMLISLTSLALSLSLSLSVTVSRRALTEATAQLARENSVRNGCEADPGSGY